MPHCQICLHTLPEHFPNCPVATGEPVSGSEPWLQELLQRNAQQSQAPGLIGMSIGGATHDTGVLSARIEWLEKEVHGLRARVAKLERAT